MKTQRKLRHKTNSIATGRWAAYAAAAAASSLAAAPSAEAHIHYSGPINRRIRGDDVKIRFPLGAGVGVIVATHRWVPYGSTTRSGIAGFQLYAGSPSVNGFVPSCIPSSDPASVSNLNPGDAISARPFVPNGGILASTEYGCTHGRRGQFKEPGLGLVGFKFNNGAGDQYGWARLRMMGAPNNEYKLVDFAYGDPGEKVLAGQRESNGSAPVLESLGGLALGATGLLAWRRRRER